MDNLRRDISLRQLKDLFFEVYGIVPLDNYNVIGDGVTDNRLQIQQAIYDAIAAGAKYIFVTKGEYFYSGTLQRADEVIFMGNATDSTIANIEIQEFPEVYLNPEKFINIGTIQLYCTNGDIPNNFLPFNGGSIDEEEYPELYKLIVNTLPYLTYSGGDTRMKYIIKAK